VKAEPIPKAVTAFLNEHIDSVVELEALLLLYAHRDRVWPASEIARELRIDRSWPQTELQSLCAKGILSCNSESESSYKFAPRTPEIDTTVGQLAAAYADRRVTVISLIFSKPVDKLKGFGDAFRIRREPGNG
jgi:hypothetical protein